MADRPILFSAPMIRALLAGTKTQTRRVIKKPAADNALAVFGPEFLLLPGNVDMIGFARGDRLWVREGHSLHNAHGQHRDDGNRWGPWGGLPIAINPEGDKVAYYREGFDRCDGGPWRPSIHMPRWASRLTLTVTEVRVQRLQDISVADAKAEGLVQACDGLARDVQGRHWGPDARHYYRNLWTSLHGPGSWEANPWVVAVSFDVRKGNIDG